MWFRAYISDTVALFYLGLARSTHGDVPVALEAFGRVQRLRPDYAPAALEHLSAIFRAWERALQIE